MKWREEEGFVGGLEALPFGFLVFVAGTLLLVNAWAVFDCHLAASASAREAVRAYVESAGSETDALQASEAAAVEALEGHGKQVERMSIAWSGARLARCQPVTVTVTYAVPLVVVPWIGAFGRGVLSTSARHREVVDPYRRGLSTDGFDAEACNA
jgi:hypothetical protein